MNDFNLKFKYIVDTNIISNGLAVFSNSKNNIDDEICSVSCNKNIVLRFALYLYYSEPKISLEINKSISHKNVHEPLYAYNFGEHFAITFSKGDIILSSHKLIFFTKYNNEVIGTRVLSYELL